MLVDMEDFHEQPYKAAELSDDEIWLVVKPGFQERYGRFRFWCMLFFGPYAARGRIIRNFRSCMEMLTESHREGLGEDGHEKWCSFAGLDELARPVSMNTSRD